MSILATICAERAEDAARGRRSRPALSMRRSASPPRRAFAKERGPFVVAECKRASPSRGLMVDFYEPAGLARAYERGGAAAVSVLTEPRHFLGEEGHLVAVRSATGLPVLRKDFIVDEWQVHESWAMGADAILLIVAVLGPDRLHDLVELAHGLGLSTLVEVRDRAEFHAAAAVEPSAIGFNARDLRDFSVDSGLAAGVYAELDALRPAGCALVAESGIKSPADAAAMRRAGYDGLLVGEALATAADPEKATRALVEGLR